MKISKIIIHALAVLKMMRKELEASYDRFGAVKTLKPNPDYVPAP